MSSENIELVRRSIAAFNAGDEQGVESFFSEDAELWPDPRAPEAGPFTGRDQIRFFETLREGWKPGSDVGGVHEIKEAGAKVLTSFEWRAAGDASGIEVSSEWISVSTIRGGQIVRLQFFLDRDAAINAAGLK